MRELAVQIYDIYYLMQNNFANVQILHIPLRPGSWYIDIVFSVVLPGRRLGEFFFVYLQHNKTT